MNEYAPEGLAVGGGSCRAGTAPKAERQPAGGTGRSPLKKVYYILRIYLRLALFGVKRAQTLCLYMKKISVFCSFGNKNYSNFYFLFIY